MNNLNPSRKPPARRSAGNVYFLFLLAGLLAAVTPLRADNPSTYLFQIAFSPTSVALDSSGNIYVTSGETVVKFNHNGNYLTQWGSYGNGNGQFNDPSGIAVDSSNNVYVADIGRNSIVKFDRNGNYLTQFGSYGIGNGQLDAPFGIAVDDSNDIYVADEGNNRVQKFDRNGNYLMQWGSYGIGNGQFNLPFSIAIDSSNNVYVVDRENNRIEKFTSSGGYQAQWGSSGSGNGQFNDPFGIAVDSTGNFIYVADSGNNRIEVFANNANVVPPIITSQPTNETVPVGANVTFSVNVAGAPPLAYQWSRNDVAVPGATNASITLANVSLTDSAAYSVLVTNINGSGLSSNAVLTVLPVAEFLPPTFVFYSSAVPGGFSANLSFLALDASNNVYVTDEANDSVDKFDSRGNYLTQWGTSGSSNGQFDAPEGIAVDNSNHVYVADDNNDRIEEFDQNGGYLAQWGNSGIGSGQFNDPVGIAMDDSNNMYVADEGNNRVQMLDRNGNHFTQFGSYGMGNGQFNLPFSTAVDSSNNVYVVDDGNNRIEKFDRNGSYLAQWGSSGNGNGQFNDPFGIAVDRGNNVYVVDGGNDRIEKFDRNGGYLAQWGGGGSSNGQFYDPQGIAVDSSGNYIYVADNGNNRIQVFVNNTSIIPPFITAQPTNQIIPAGANVTFGLSAVGGDPFAYLWSSNNVVLPGATNATLTLTNVSVADSAAYSVLVTYSYGTALSSNAVLTVLPSIVLTQPASSITTTGAVLNGSVTVGPDETVVWFEWGTDTNYGNITDETIVPGNNASNSLSAVLNGLTDSVYHYLIDAANDFGIVYGNDEGFAIGLAPTATTLTAVNRANGSTLNATVNPNGLDTTVYFRWGTSSYLPTNSTPVVDLGAGVGPVNASSFITGLTPFTQYSYQVVASNYLGTIYGVVDSFLAPPFTSIPAGGWQSVASSADGTKLVAGGKLYFFSTNFVYTSTNSGATWTPVSLPSRAGKAEAVASSADGTELVAGFGFASDLLYISTNSGAIWRQITNLPVAIWNSVALSADGTKLAAAALNLQGIYTSTDSGVSWTHQTNGLLPYVDFIYIASSADGSKLVTASGWTGKGPIFTSTNSGVNWTKATNAPIAYWNGVASSANGNQLLACSYSGNVYISTNAGVNWTETSLPTNNWNSVAESADGAKMVALANSVIATFGLGGGGIFTSTDSGVTWVSNNVPSGAWTCAAMSADGNEFLATIGSPSTTGGIYVSQTTPSPILNLSAEDNVLSWIIPSLDFILQQSPDLVNWTDVTNLSVLNLTNLQNQVVLPPPDGNSFFRLIH